MRITPVFLLLVSILLGGAATLFAEPEDELEPLMELKTVEHAPTHQVEAIVRGLDETPTWQARVEATFLRIEAVRAAEILGANRPTDGAAACVVPKTFAQRLIGCVRGAGSIRSEPLPPLVLFAGQTGRCTAGGRHSYLQDFDTVQGNNARITKPLMGRIHDGTAVEVTPRREDGALVLELRAAWAEAIRPIPRFETELPGVVPDPKVTIQLPEMAFAEIRERVALPPGGGYILAGHEFPRDEKSWRFVVLRVQTVRR